MGEATTSDSTATSSTRFVGSGIVFGVLRDRIPSRQEAIASNFQSQLEVDHDYRNGKTANSF